MPNFAIESAVSLEQIVAVLNVTPPTQAAESAFWDRYVEKKGVIPSTEYRDFAAQLTSKRLRVLVDEWLKTGTGSDGYERPLRRRVPASGCFVVAQYVQNHPPRVYFDPDAGWTLSLGSLLSHPSGTGSMHAATEAAAHRLFFFLIAGDLGGCLCKCHYPRCGCYFILHNAREKYRNGTFCRPDHHKSAKAADCMKQKRSSVRSKLVELAAESLRQSKAGPEWHFDTRLKIKVRDHIRLVARRNRLLEPNSRLALNWVTRNWKAIEQSRSKADLAS